MKHFYKIKEKGNTFFSYIYHKDIQYFRSEDGKLIEAVTIEGLDNIFFDIEETSLSLSKGYYEIKEINYKNNIDDYHEWNKNYIYYFDKLSDEVVSLKPVIKESIHKFTGMILESEFVGYKLKTNKYEIIISEDSVEDLIQKNKIGILDF